MNAKANRSMNRFLYTVVLLFLVSSSLNAQKYERAVRNNLWNDALNVAGIRQDTLTIYYASASGSYEFGDYKTLSQSQSQWSAAVSAATVTHFERFSLTGSFSFMDTEARNMSGSMFIDNGLFPVDVYEFTPGHKTFQKYGVTGGFSVDLNDRWRLGASLDYKSQNVAKRKDLRYSTYRLDMDVAPSLMYVGDGYALGVSYVFKRNTETVSAAQIGSAENAPFAFFDEGLCLGNYQVWTGNATRLKESGVSGLPVQQNISAAAVQFSWGGLFAQIYAGWKWGRAGERQTIWYRYFGPEANALLSFRTGRNTLRGSLAWSRTTNNESVQDKVTEGGISLVKEYDGNIVFKKNSLDMELEYEYLASVWDGRLKASFSDLQRISTPMYPYVYTRELKTFALSAEGFYRFGDFEAGAALSYFMGFSQDGEHLVSSDTNIGSRPYRMSEIYDDLCRFETCPAVSAELSFDWNIVGRLHLDASIRCSYGVNYVEIKSYRLISMFGLSYIF